MISIHAPAKGATRRQATGHGHKKNFNPRTREGCDRSLTSTSEPRTISIHAPAKGATRPSGLNPNRSGFQSTHPRRVRPMLSTIFLQSATISIHAPAKGATEIICQIGARAFYFNPRTREGCDPFLLIIDFQDQYFNPRTREGCDETDDGRKYLVRISIHAPAKGATMYGISLHNSLSYFNPRTREGCDLSVFRSIIMVKNFNPRTREGCDNCIQ